MSQPLTRAGIFKAKPIEWAVRRTEGSKSVAINIRFHIIAQLDTGEWVDWSTYEDHHVYGAFYVVKKDGGVNQNPVEQLSQCLGWNGSFAQVLNQAPPDVVVQITVKEDEYHGKTSFKVQWMNPGDHAPGMRGEDESGAKELDAMFGSQLRAVATASSGAPKAAPSGKPAPPPSRKNNESVAPLGTGEEVDNSKGPFPWEEKSPADREADARSRQ